VVVSVVYFFAVRNVVHDLFGLLAEEIGKRGANTSDPSNLVAEFLYCVFVARLEQRLQNVRGYQQEQGKGNHPSQFELDAIQCQGRFLFLGDRELDVETAYDRVLDEKKAKVEDRGSDAKDQDEASERARVLEGLFEDLFLQTVFAVMESLVSSPMAAIDDCYRWFFGVRDEMGSLWS